MKKLGLAGKLYLVIGMFALTAVALSALGVWGMNGIYVNLIEMQDDADHEVFAMSNLYSKFQQVAIGEYRFVTGQKDRLQLISDEMDQAHSELVTLLEAADKKATGYDKEKLSIFQQRFAEWWTWSKEVRALGLAGKMDEAISLMPKQRDARIASETAIKELIQEGHDTMQGLRSDADKNYSTTRVLMLILTAIAIGTGLAVSVVVLKRVIRTIDQVISDLDSNSEQVTSASTQIASSSEELSQAAAEQASSLGETASAVEEMSATIKKNSDNADNAAGSSEKSHASATKGKEVVDSMITTVDEINAANNRIMEQINHSNAQIGEITKVIAEIAAKTQVINDIVFQTKLLSFNASVEAARAGEHGKGFAVVAEEVGNLAQMSGNAAKEIGAMLEGSIKKVENIVAETKTSVEKLIEEGRSKVLAGTQVAKLCGTVLDEIVQDTTSANLMIREISTASREQAQGIQEVTKAMGQLDQVTQQNAAASEQTASAAEQLSAQAASLKGVVQMLVAEIKGEGARKTAAARPAPKKQRAPKSAQDHAQSSINESTHGKILHLKTKAPTPTVVNVETIPADDPRFVEV